jgi:hypothetical protein
LAQVDGGTEPGTAGAPVEIDRLRSTLEGNAMLWTIVVVLVVLWALGLVTSTTMGGFIHLLLVLAIAVVLIRVIQGRRAI